MALSFATGDRVHCPVSSLGHVLESELGGLIVPRLGSEFPNLHINDRLAPRETCTVHIDAFSYLVEDRLWDSRKKKQGMHIRSILLHDHY